MKRLLSILLSLALVTGCGSTPSESSPEDVKKEAERMNKMNQEMLKKK